MGKKLLVVSIVSSLSLTAFLAGYLLSQKDFHRNPKSISTGNILNKFSDKDSGSEPQTKSSDSPKILSSRSVLSPTLSKEKNSILYYEKGTGKVFEVSLKDLLKDKPVSDVPLSNLLKTVWSPSKKEVISSFYYPKGIHHKYFSYKTGKSFDFGINIKSPVFSPDGSQIAYFGKKENVQGIFISLPDGSSSKLILPSRLENNEVYWLSNDLLAFQTDTENGSELYTLSKTGSIKKILGPINGLEAKWSRDGSQLLFSQKNGTKTDLSYKNLPLGSETSLNVSTSASKCDWGIDNKTIVCGVPRPQAPGDEIYEIGLDGTKNLLSSPALKINTEEIFISGPDDNIVILNGLDDKLYILNK